MSDTCSYVDTVESLLGRFEATMFSVVDESSAIKSIPIMRGISTDIAKARAHVRVALKPTSDNFDSIEQRNIFGGENNELKISLNNEAEGIYTQIACLFPFDLPDKWVDYDNFDNSILNECR